jgi:hypothetical protein
MAAASLRDRIVSSLKLEVATFCCGCSLKAGVLFYAIVLLINACLGLAGEAAVWGGLLNAVAATAEGEYLPPGTKITDVRIQGALIFLGLYSLATSAAGFFAALHRNRCASTVLYVSSVLNFGLTVAIMLSAWRARRGGPAVRRLTPHPPAFLPDSHVDGGRLLRRAPRRGALRRLQFLPPRHRPLVPPVARPRGAELLCVQRAPNPLRQQRRP